MAYLAIYRRFRPTTFSKVIGQEHIVQTLINQIKTDRIGHAYLFCGARGTGKTTAAKIFARAINCENPISGSPCGECETCKSLLDPANLDILEIDAASNNKVDNVREIRDKVQYPPVSGKYKVYIIDEVHMLTTEAFNALLKTLEEPPKHAIFILATTEPHKLPATILSRCMRFDFKLVSDKEIAKAIAEIYDELGKTYEPEAVLAIARAGQGSVRDALSVADMCVSFSEQKLTYSDVISVIGASDYTKTIEFLSSVLGGDIGSVLRIIDELSALGKSVGLVCKDACETLRNTLIVKTSKNANDVLLLPEAQFLALKELATICDEHRIFRALEIFTSVENDLKYSTNARVVFETSAIKATLPKEDYNIDALISRIEKLENALKQGGFKAVDTAPSVDNAKILALTSRLDKLENDIKNAVVAKKEMVLETQRVEEKPFKEEVEETKEDKLAESDFDDGYVGFEGLEVIEKPLDENSIVEGQESFDLSMAETVEENKSKEEIEEPKKEETPKVEEPKTQETPKVEEKPVTIKVSPERLWGGVLRRLRKDKELMLWMACQDLNVQISGSKLVVYALDSNVYAKLTEKAGYNLIQSIVNEYAPLKLEIVDDNNEPKDSFEEDIEKAKEILGNVKVED